MLTANCGQRRMFKVDSETSDNSDTDKQCSLGASTTTSSDEAHSKSKITLSSPVWLSARTKLQRFAFHKSDTKSDKSAGDTNLDNSQQEDAQVICSSTCTDKRNATLLSLDNESNLTSSTFPKDNVHISIAGFPPLAGPPSPQSQPSPSMNEGIGSPQLEEDLDDTLMEEDGDCSSDSEDDYSDKQKEAILEFLNDSSQDELCDVPGCSLTKAKLLVKHRPFDKWEDVVRTLCTVSFIPSF